MSFILDALRKSETERQKDGGPPLSRIPVASTRSVVPVWARVALAALGAAVLGLGGGWWQSMRNPELAAEPPGAAPGSGPAAGGPSGANGRADDANAFAGTRDATRPAGSAASVDVAPAQELSVAAATPPPAPVAGVRDSVETSPVSAAGRTAAAAAPLRTLAELTASGVALPSLTLELLVFHADPSGRFVFINGGRYAEGQRLPEGPRVVDIRAESVVLNQDGRDFLLLPQ